MSQSRSTKERLARYMDPQAFSERVGKSRKDAMKARREISIRRAAAAIRFFKMPENHEALVRMIASEQ